MVSGGSARLDRDGFEFYMSSPTEGATGKVISVLGEVYYASSAAIFIP
jgi:hypothetical protein